MDRYRSPAHRLSSVVKDPALASASALTTLIGDSARTRTWTRELWRLGCSRYTTLPSLHVDVSLVEPLGSDTLVHAKLGQQPLIARCAPRVGLAAMQTLQLQADVAHLHLFDPQTGRAFDQLST